MPPKITIGSTAEKRRLRRLADERYGLEEGHSNWSPIDDGFRCRSCPTQARTGGYLSRPDIVLAIGCQPVASGV